MRKKMTLKDWFDFGEVWDFLASRIGEHLALYFGGPLWLLLWIIRIALTVGVVGGTIVGVLWGFYWLGYKATGYEGVGAFCILLGIWTLFNVGLAIDTARYERKKRRKNETQS